jgi:hypothetical protein
MAYYNYLYSFDLSVKLTDADIADIAKLVTPKEGSAKNVLNIKLIEGDKKNFLLLGTLVTKAPTIDFSKLKEKIGDSLKQYSVVPKSKKIQCDSGELKSYIDPLDV